MSLNNTIMENSVWLTVTTKRGSAQFHLCEMRRTLLLLAALMLCFVMVSGYLLWHKSQSELFELASAHKALNDRYALAVESKQDIALELEELNSAYIDQLHRPSIELVQLIDSLDSIRKLSSDNDAAEGVVSIEAQYQKLAVQMGLSPEAVAQRDNGLIAAAYERLNLLYGIPNGMPMKEYKMSDGFGERIHPLRKSKAKHKGVDLKAPKGTPVYAPANGVVSRASTNGTFGKLLILEHGYGFKTKYAHLSEFAVKSGTPVQKGTLIGYVGSTGASLGNHLHYEVHYLNSAVDPKHFMDWGLHNYESLFAQVKDVPWESLRSLHPLKRLQIAQR